MSDFSVGEIVKLKGMGDALWLIEELGEQSFYSSGSPLSEEPTLISLYMPEPRLPRSAYPERTWTHREFIEPVPAMLVLALEADSRRRSSAAELLVEQRYRRRMKKLRQLEKEANYRVGGLLRLEVYKRAHPELLYEQEDFKADWSNFPLEGGR